jgi:hypothetical protein
MIKPSDIKVAINRHDRMLGMPMTVEAHLERHEVVSIDRREEHNQKLIEYAKQRVRRGILAYFYGDLIDDIEEMYRLAAINLPYDKVDEVIEIKKRIDKTLRGDE